MADNKSNLTRRDFGAVSLGAGVAAAAVTANAAALPVKETDVEVTTPDGKCDAAFFHPTTGTHPGVLIWPDAFGLRAEMRKMASRLAGEGFAVLVVNQYYRGGKASTLGLSTDAFSDPAKREGLTKAMSTVTPDKTEIDARAHIAFIDAQPQMKKGAKIGTVGYCMGGSMTLRTAAAVPDRVGAAMSCHGGGLVTANPNSPHLLAPKIKAKVIIAIGSDDDQKEPDSKTVLAKAFTDAKNPATVEVYKAIHGWCVADLKERYNEAEAERAWANMVALYKQNLG